MITRFFNTTRLTVAACIAGMVFFSCKTPAAGGNSSSIAFKKQILSREYISEGVAVGDMNNDGKTDVVAGTFWWDAPDWTKHELTNAEIHASIGGYGNSFLNFTIDVNQDGWLDYVKIGFPSKEAYWYENPKNKEGHWIERLVYPSVGNESPAFVDVDGDGREDLLCNDPRRKKMIWVSPPTMKGDTAWTTHIISNDTLRGTHLFTHGLGLGDINGDGRKDVITREGWWEAPVDRKQEDWTWHAANLGPECAEMYVMDLDQDGDSDVISSSAHKYGIWWYEQVKQGDTTAWIQHEIYKAFSQSHGLALADINNDGHPDLITGKRFWAHNGSDPGEREPAVLYWFEYQPGKEPKWIPHQIDDHSGVGLHLVVKDMNNDGLMDVITGNKNGIYVFEQIKK